MRCGTPGRCPTGRSMSRGRSTRAVSGSPSPTVAACTRPRALHASSSALAGRGMAIVEVLAMEWWAEQSPSRTTVHALLSA